MAQHDYVSAHPELIEQALRRRRRLTDDDRRRKDRKYSANQKHQKHGHWVPLKIPASKMSGAGNEYSRQTAFNVVIEKRKCEAHRGCRRHRGAQGVAAYFMAWACSQLTEGFMSAYE